MTCSCRWSSSAILFIAKFRITYRDPETEEKVSVEREFHDFVGRATLDGKPVGETMKITAREWAEDFGYTAADKGPYTVTEIR